MPHFSNLLLFWTTVIISDTSGRLSYYVPKFAECRQWNTDGISFADSSTLLSGPRHIFITTDDTLYATLPDTNQVLRWPRGNASTLQDLAVGSNQSFGIFVSANEEIYIDNGQYDHVVTVWTANGTNGVAVMNVPGACNSLFIDVLDHLYCSNNLQHQVVRIYLPGGSQIAAVVAGNGLADNTSYTLDNPHGIFVDQQLNLYVADMYNDRVQLFAPNDLNGTTVAGGSRPIGIALDAPAAVIIDADGYMYITDYYNNRVVASGPRGFRCLLGCTGAGGAVANQFNRPYGLAFDSHGHLFVSDKNNRRIQKFLLKTNSCDISYNQPDLCPTATWTATAVTVANSTVVGSLPYGIFVDRNNTVYITATSFNRALVWFDGDAQPSISISVDTFQPAAVFAAADGAIYVDNGNARFRVDRWSRNATNRTVALFVNVLCSNLFVDIDGNLYCSLTYYHTVVKKPPTINANDSSIVAGNGNIGNTRHMLHTPRGIFVDLQLHLYVADCDNNRIQFYSPGSATGMTIVGNGSPNGTILDRPMGIWFDTNERMYILEYGNNRVVRVGSNGVQCIVACTGMLGTRADQLHLPWTFSFDSYGNIFVLDHMNSRVQKFLIDSQSCDPTTALPSTTAATTSPGNNSSSTCETLLPCQNNASCSNDNTTLRGYRCQCLPGFGGTYCETDYRPCQSTTCWNNGVCNATSNSTFSCTCTPGWWNNRCQSKVDYCANQTCSHNGVCQSGLLDYTCRCFEGSYTGRDCQTASKRVLLRQILAKSFVSIAIAALISVAVFVLVLDILKFILGIDLARDDEQSKRAHGKRCLVGVRFVYVNSTSTALLETVEPHVSQSKPTL